MFTALRNLAHRIIGVLNATKQYGSLPVVTRAMAVAIQNAKPITEHEFRYNPNCMGGRKTKGRRDRSQQQRSNRRKAAARA